MVSDCTHNKNRLFYHKIAIFDLDDTLYIGNSHIEWLCYYYNTKFFKSIFFKAFGKLFSTIHNIVIWKLYGRVPAYAKKGFILPFRASTIKLLEKKREEGYFPLIVSNAPIELIKNAALVIKVDFMRADINSKAEKFKEKYQCDILFVCTDNKTDLDLIEASDEAIIICKEKHHNFFCKNLCNKNYRFMSCEED